ncbi:MAG: hypothetical protein ACI3YH_08795, partial [Eubacteriales bacterium]
ATRQSHQTEPVPALQAFAALFQKFFARFLSRKRVGSSATRQSHQTEPVPALQAFAVLFQKFFAPLSFKKAGKASERNPIQFQ